MTTTFWIMRQTGHPRFPYRLTIARGQEILLDLFTQDRWPGTKGNIFCIRAEGREEMMRGGEEIERVTVVDYRVTGAKLTIVLDRSRQKRCSFLFLVKKYKTRPGEYEQIFWQTQQGLSGHKVKYKLSYYPKEPLKIFIDSGEKYAWNFSGAQIIKERLPVGDYALKDKFGFLAIVERKTFANMMKDLGNLKVLHQRLTELSLCQNSALVIEGTYGDFLNQKKIAPYSPAFTSKALAEIQTIHPRLPVIFADSRRGAMIWTFNFFQMVWTKNKEDVSQDLQRSRAKFRPTTKLFLENMVRRAVFTEMPREFATTDLTSKFPQYSPTNIRTILDNLTKEGVLQSYKQGRELIWVVQKE